MKKVEYVDFEIGDPQTRAHVDAIHSQNPNGEYFTGELAQKVSGGTGASWLKSMISRDVMDLNRPRGRFNYPAIDEYRDVLSEIWEQKGFSDELGLLRLPVLHLSFHGMQNDWGKDLEIGTGYGHYCDPSVKQWFTDEIKKLSQNVGIDDIFPGYTFRSVLRDGDVYGSTSFLGYGPCLNAFQIEISREFREKNGQQLIDFFIQLIQDFQKNFQNWDFNKAAQIKRE